MMFGSEHGELVDCESVSIPEDGLTFRYSFSELFIYRNVLPFPGVSAVLINRRKRVIVLHVSHRRMMMK